MRVPTVLSFARIAAHVVASSPAAPCDFAREGVTPAQMHSAPYTIVAYVFDNSRTVVEKNDECGFQHLCLSRERRAFCKSRMWPQLSAGLPWCVAKTRRRSISEDIQHEHHFTASSHVVDRNCHNDSGDRHRTGSPTDDVTQSRIGTAMAMSAE
jgi:hypothetical protein